MATSISAQTRGVATGEGPNANTGAPPRAGLSCHRRRGEGTQMTASGGPTDNAAGSVPNRLACVVVKSCCECRCPHTGPVSRSELGQTTGLV